MFRWKTNTPKSLLTILLMALILFTVASCIQVQKAAGCNNPGLFECRDRVPSSPTGQDIPLKKVGELQRHQDE